MLKFERICIENHNFHTLKEPVYINDVDIEHILVSNKQSLKKKIFKYFIGFVNNFNDKIKKPLVITN